MNWDDLRVAGEVHKAGSFAGAASAPKIDVTTVARRVSRLQAHVGGPLFGAAEGGRRATPLGLKVLRHAVRMEGAASDITGPSAKESEPVGTVRIATTDSGAVFILAPRMHDILKDFQGLAVEFLASTDTVAFSRWKAAIAIRLGKPERGDFLITKLGELTFNHLEPVGGDVDARPAIVCAYP
ncbi:MAG: LysR family transcriptional regulator [Devosia sp.]